jgi:phosphatidylinositol phospholipase C, delta
MAFSLSASPSLRALTELNQDSPPAVKSPRSQQRQFRIHNINTSMPQSFTFTPASARSVSSTAPNSLQSSPETLNSHEYPSNRQSPCPLDLPESALADDYAVKNTTLKDVTVTNKAPGLIRKLSQSARTGVQSTGQKLRRKASSSNHDKRDQSTGPITRRRSDSKTSMSNGASATDLTPSLWTLWASGAPTTSPISLASRSRQPRPIPKALLQHYQISLSGAVR